MYFQHHKAHSDYFAGILEVSWSQDMFQLGQLHGFKQAKYIMQCSKYNIRWEVVFLPALSPRLPSLLLCR